MNYRMLIDKANRREEIPTEEIINFTPRAFHERIRKISEKVSTRALVYLLAVTEFYGGLESSFEIIERTIPKTVNSTPEEDEKHEEKYDRMRKLYEGQKLIFYKRRARLMSHSLIALEVAIEEAYRAKTAPPPFGVGRNRGFFGQSEGRVYYTS